MATGGLLLLFDGPSWSMVEVGRWDMSLEGHRKLVQVERGCIKWALP